MAKHRNSIYENPIKFRFASCLTRNGTHCAHILINTPEYYQHYFFMSHKCNLLLCVDSKFSRNISAELLNRPNGIDYL